MESALFAIRQHLPDFSDAERKVAELVLEEPRAVLHFTVSDLAGRSGVSQAAVVRFCRRIDAESYSDFKLRLSQDVFVNSVDNTLPVSTLESDASPAAVVRGIIGSLQNSLARLETVMDVNLLARAASALFEARTSYLFGLGASGLVALDLYQKLIRIGLPCTYTQDADLQITAACTMRPEDVAFVVSYSGETPVILTVAEEARKSGATVVTLTMDGDNRLRRAADIPLVVPSFEKVYRTGAVASRISQLAVVDMVYTLIVSNNLNAFMSAFERTMAATHHGR